jgi:hypothetical protein
MMILLLSLSFPVLGDHLLNPVGGNLKKFICEFNNIDKKTYKKIYLRPVRKNSLPFFWWYLGDGLAFNLFSDPNISYALYKATDKEIHNALLIDVDNKPVILNIKYFE